MLARSLLRAGPRGVGKTVLPKRIASEAEARGFITVVAEPYEDKSLPAILIPSLYEALIGLYKLADSGGLTKRALRVLSSFVCATRVKYQDIEFGAMIEEENGTADSGNFEHDLIDLFLEIGKASKEKRTATVFCIDDLHHLNKEQLSFPITALHKCTQHQLPVALIGTGSPELVGNAGRAKSYAERLFEYQGIEPCLT